MIDDDPLVSVVVRRAMEGIEHRLFTAADGRTGVEQVEAKRPDLVVLDNILPDGLGVEALTKIHELAPSVPILFVTARGSGGTAIEAMKLSAFDYLPKPLEPAKLRAQIDRALTLRKLVESKSHDDEPLPPSGSDATMAGDPQNSLVGECAPMQVVFKAIGKVATQDVAVLVRGEHGSGKESVAREIHRHSQRSEGPLIKLYCRGWDDARLSAELFGEKNGRPGRIADAEGGTLVLQEVGSLSAPMQARLLQAVRDGVYEPAGETTEHQVACRFIAITSEDLESKTRAGEFRSDLYYALSSFVIELPALRQRRGDLPLLIEHTLRKLHAITNTYGIDEPRVSEEVMRALCNHLWPGNLDELESVLKRSLVEQKGNLLLATELFPDTAETVVSTTTDAANSRDATNWQAFVDLRVEGGADTIHAEAVAEAEQKVFKRVLRHTRGNQAQAARMLGITRASLRKKLRMYGMAPRPTDELS